MILITTSRFRSLCDRVSAEITNSFYAYPSLQQSDLRRVKIWIGTVLKLGFKPLQTQPESLCIYICLGFFIFDSFQQLIGIQISLKCRHSYQGKLSTREGPVLEICLVGINQFEICIQAITF